MLLPGKVSVIGAGRVGEIIALGLIQNQAAAEVLLVDIVEGMAEGKALDLKQASAIFRSDVKIKGTTDYAKIRGSDIVIITAGLPRKPGMERIDLLGNNIKVTREIVDQVLTHASDAILIMLTNPVDILTYALWKISGFPSNRVFGVGGMLDASRFRNYIAIEANISAKDVQAIVLGGHGDVCVPLVSHAKVGGLPVDHFLTKEKLASIVDRTRKGGGEIVSLLKSGSSYFAPGNAAAELVKSILNDERRVLPVVTYLGGKYGIKDLYAGAPAIIGRHGIEKVLELELTPDELEEYQGSLTEVQKQLDKVRAEGLL